MSAPEPCVWGSGPLRFPCVTRSLHLFLNYMNMTNSCDCILGRTTLFVKIPLPSGRTKVNSFRLEDCAKIWGRWKGQAQRGLCGDHPRWFGTCSVADRLVTSLGVFSPSETSQAAGVVSLLDVLLSPLCTLSGSQQCSCSHCGAPMWPLAASTLFLGSYFRSYSVVGSYLSLWCL